MKNKNPPNGWKSRQTLSPPLLDASSNRQKSGLRVKMGGPRQGIWSRARHAEFAPASNPRRGPYLMVSRHLGPQAGGPDHFGFRCGSQKARCANPVLDGLAWITPLELANGFLRRLFAAVQTGVAKQFEAHSATYQGQHTERHVNHALFVSRDNAKPKPTTGIQPPHSSSVSRRGRRLTARSG